MTKLKGPLFSIDAKGKLGKSLVFSSNKGIKRVSKYYEPANPRTIIQQDNRNIFSYAILSWQALDEGQKEDYNQSAANLKLNMSGYNYYIQTYLAAYGEAPPPPPPEPILNGLIAWLKFDENGGGTAYDSINGHNATLYNATWDTGKINSCVRLNGSNAYLQIPHHDDLNPRTHGHTLEFWLHPDNDTAFGNIVTKYQTGSIAWYNYVELDGNDNIWYGYRGLGGSENSSKINSGYDLRSDWHHIVNTRADNGTGKNKLYVNGNLIEEGTSRILDNDVNPTVPLKIGVLTVGWYKGKIDELRIYNRPLTLAEIQNNYSL